jgi:hypothetical protein
MELAEQDELISRHIKRELWMVVRSSHTPPEILARRHWWFAFLIGDLAAYRRGAAQTVSELFAYVVEHREAIMRELIDRDAETAAASN